MNDDIDRAYEALLLACTAHFEKYSDPEVLRVARKICKSHGHDPDVMVMGYAYQPPLQGARSVTLMPMAGTIRPQWVVFYEDARLALEAVKQEASP